MNTRTPMKLRYCFNIMVLTMLLAAASVACAPVTRKPIALASFTKNYVDVSVTLEHASDGGVFLSATFTPQGDHHLYSKDIPIHGLEGLGRPTLLELTEKSQMIALGELIESVQAQEPDF